MAKCNRNLVIHGELKASCACGGWQYQGLSHEARLVIEQAHKAHIWACPLEEKSATSPAKKKRARR